MVNKTKDLYRLICNKQISVFLSLSSQLNLIPEVLYTFVYDIKKLSS